jgi:uncharacterized protein YdeI (YjbR/CyaY-like superfamily)
MAEIAHDNLPIIPFASQADWENWLEGNHSSSTGLWLKIAKKASGVPTVAFGEAIDVALCFGWIDGQRRSYDDVWYLQRLTPRRPRSRWSEINQERVRLLTEQGRMRPAGFAEVERAKEDGRWDEAYASPSKMEMPGDLQRALDNNRSAADTFAALKSADRYSILYRLHHSKKPETRARLLEGFIAKLEAGEATNL